MSARVADWSSAIAPNRPPVPREWHWAAGLACAVVMLASVSFQYAQGDAVLDAPEEEAVVVTLGGQASRLDPPPPEVETQQEVEVVAERAEDSPPVAVPVDPRAVAGSEDVQGPPRSGTGAGTEPAPPPPAPPPPPPPPPPQPTQVTQRYVDISVQAYAQRMIYPPSSLSRGDEGQGILRVTVARDGKVLDWSIARSTGHDRLDKEIRRVARVVKRLEPLPANFAYDSTRVDIPITFTIEVLRVR